MRKCMIIRIAACAAVAVVIGAAGTALAAEVAADEAREAAQGWAALREALTGKERFAGAEIADVKSYEGKDGRGRFYVVSFEGGGFAVTSGDTEIAPILAYSEDGEFVASDENPLWVMLTTDVAGRTKRLENLAQSRRGAEDGDDDLEYGAEEPEPSANASAWARLREAAKAPEPTGRPLLKAANPRQNSVSDLRVAPMCPLWNQYFVNGEAVYNYYTPSNYLSGCVATAMAEVMHAFKWPQGKVEIAAEHSGRFRDDVTVPGTVISNVWHIGGTYGDRWEYPGPAFGGPYDWDSMVADPLGASNAGTLTEMQRQAIGLLCRDCGISVNMNYDIGGSGSSTRRIGPQLVSQFGYANAAVFHNPGVGSTYDQQMNAILPSLDMGSPCAIGLSNHSIVADGYGYTDSRIYVHFNYGWGSGSGSTAWYTPALDGETDADYPVIGSMVYNIWTPDAGIAAGSAIVKGVVLEEDGATPAAGTVVTATESVSGASVAVTADADGAFTLYLPPGDDWAITATVGFAKARRIIGEVGTATTDARPVVYNRRDVMLVLQDLGWVNETAGTTGLTGSWSSAVAYDAATQKAMLEGENVFMPNTLSGGNRVTMTVTAAFDAIPLEQDAPSNTTQGAIWLGTNGCFQVWTFGGWVDVEADGVTPQIGVDYTFRFTFDYAAKTYSVAVQYGAEWKPLVGRVIPNAPSFPLATSASAVSGVRFTGDGVFTSLLGEWVNKTRGFVLSLF